MTELNKVLHVDDDDDIRVITRMALEAVGGFTVQQHSNGPDALENAADFAPDLFLLDVMMPGMGGVETCEKLRELPGLADVPVIYVTAKAQDHETRALLDAGAIAVITKPFDPMTLCDQLRAAWAEHAAKV